MRIAYPNLHNSLETYHDLKECWKSLMLQELYQQRMERCSRSLNESYIHPHQRFFYPVNGYSFSSEEISENLLSYIFWQVEAIRSEGFSEEEFYGAKHMLLNQLQYLASNAALPDHTFLASYYADQFLLGDRCPTYESFLGASAQLIEEIESQDLVPHIDAFLAEDNRSIQIVYPKLTEGQGLTKDQIEKMIERIASLSSFYRDSEIVEEDELWILDTKNKAPSESLIRINQRKATESSPSSIQVETALLQSAGNAPVVLVSKPSDPKLHVQSSLFINCRSMIKRKELSIRSSAQWRTKTSFSSPWKNAPWRRKERRSTMSIRCVLSVTFWPLLN